ncbi:MAG: hypothetical protein QOH21_509, partial [Acidobacteriota bacterium]|nr:hypothetical protein [Acidobacteriota bacterium]
TCAGGARGVWLEHRAPPAQVPRSTLGMTNRTPPAAAPFNRQPLYRAKTGYGFTGTPFHHSFVAGRFSIEKCRWGVPGGALPVVPT